MRREFFFGVFVLVTLDLSLLAYGVHIPWWFQLIFACLLAQGLYDSLQNRHSVKKNFPLVGHFRYMLEALRPEIQQYFVESNIDGAPINRNDRSVVYQRSKNTLQVQPFGTQDDLYKEGQEWVNHSIFPVDVDEDCDRVVIGGPDCKKPYSASRLNISAMSYGSLSAHAIEALNKGAAQGGFYHNTGEGGISDFHLKGGDLVWQLGTGYFGCRTPEGRFDEKQFTEKAKLEPVKMIELKLSQGAKPGKGGMLPGVKVTEEIARIRGVEIGKDVMSPSKHPEFSSAHGLLMFIQKLRDLSDGKPVGFKLCLGEKTEFLEIIDAMKELKIYPDFITVDGAEGGTGAAPLEFSDSVGFPLKDGLAFVYQSLMRANLKDKIRLIAAGKSLTGFDMIRNFALGADVINSARGMMLALGCIQALRCHTNHCPVGITTNRKDLVKGLNVKDKTQRVANYHEQTIKVMKSLLSAMGKRNPGELKLSDVKQRQSEGGYKTFEEIYRIP